MTHPTYDELQRENTSLKQRVEKLEDELDTQTTAYTTEAETLRAEIAKGADTADLLEAIQEKAGILNRTVTQAELPGFVGDIALQLSEHTNLQRSHKALEEKYRRLDEANHAYKATIDALRADKERLVKEAASIEAQPVTDTEARLRKELDESREEGHILMAAAKQLLQEREAFKLQFGDVCDTNSELRTQVKDLQALCDTLADIKQEEEKEPEASA